MALFFLLFVMASECSLSESFMWFFVVFLFGI